MSNYARVDNIIAAFRDIGAVTVIRTPVPDKPYRLSFIWYWLQTVGRAFTMQIPATTDFVFIPFPDNENVWIAVLYRFLHHRQYKIIFDPFISIYDTYVYNKPLRALRYPVVRLLLKWWLRWYEARLWHSADILLTDTDNHGRYLTKLLGLTKPMHKVLLNANESKFIPSQGDNSLFWNERPLRVLWYGKISLMHGVDYIWEALVELAPGPIQVTLIGDFSGFDAEKIQQWEKQGTLRYLPEKPPQYVGQEKILECLKNSHVVLGMFGRTDKSSNVITNKEYEALASERCLVTLQATREFLAHNRNCLMVDQHNPAELVAALHELNRDRTRLKALAEQGNVDYRRFASQDRLKESLYALIQQR